MAPKQRQWPSFTLHPRLSPQFDLFFVLFTPPPSLNSEIQRLAWLLGEPLGLRGKEVVFSDGAGLEPET